MDILIYVYTRPTCLTYPADVTVELALELLLPPQLEEGLPVLNAFSFTSKLPKARGQTRSRTKNCEGFALER